MAAATALAAAAREVVRVAATEIESSMFDLYNMANPFRTGSLGQLAWRPRRTWILPTHRHWCIVGGACLHAPTDLYHLVRLVANTSKLPWPVCLWRHTTP